MFVCENHYRCIIVHETYHCPICEDIEDYKSEIEKKDSELASLHQEIYYFERENE